MTKLNFRAFALCITVMLASTGFLGAQAVTFTDHQVFPLPATLYNDCTMEDMNYVSGSAHINIHGVTLQSGTNMITFHFHTQGIVYVGAVSGDTYTINENALQKVVTKANVFNNTFTDYFRVIGKGKAANLKQRLEQSIMVDNNTNPPTVVVNPPTLTYDSCK